ncbi:CDGSH iron-sulfur domain-containing protein 1-like [Hemiscyllium ocellatum]|uniref:CDGSH iron-sulfur domain-containing protein 1-like n=1 Tax=Hemiscyllium ocellatum TaxID=170820 RepID=UPI0029661387|nr:CDGSH iron-sulfur domain-containing protein 1-like [Hemiscyllium ocellatum]
MSEGQVQGGTRVEAPGQTWASGLQQKSYWIILPLTVGGMVGGYFLYRMIRSKIERNSRVNRAISKDVAKVVHSFDIEDLGANTAFCRCWRSSKFPYCDGTHEKHNLETRDNVGPLIITKLA